MTMTTSSIQRLTKTRPGWDCLHAPCQHETPGNHGIHGTEIWHAVKTEIADGRQVVLELTLFTDALPPTVPVSIDRLCPRTSTLTLHVQCPGGAECSWLPGLGCEVPFETGIGANKFQVYFGGDAYKLVPHSDELVEQALKPPEAFWEAFEAQLAALLADPSYFPQADETATMADVRARHAQAVAAFSHASTRCQDATRELGESIAKYKAGDPGYRRR